MRIGWLQLGAVLGLAPGTVLCGQTPPAPSAQMSVRVRDGSLDDYRRHLTERVSLLEACTKGRNLNACDPALVGPDDRISMTVGSRKETRLIRYDWLRAVFLQAGSPDEDSRKSGDSKQGPKPHGIGGDELPTSALLKAAKVRLGEDLVQSQAPVLPPPNHSSERAVMREVLAGADFRGLQEQTMKDSVLEKFARWLNHLFASAAGLKARSAWIGRVIVWGFILGVCVALVYGLLRLERRWRVRLTPDDDQQPAAGAASARDWQLWLEDARRAAASGEWREAIHFLYWASIARLESRRLWPADRARTPREYLAMVAPDDPRRPGLSKLTGTFERFWYGGRAAGESDYQAAESVAAALISGGSSSASGGSEGGAR